MTHKVHLCHFERSREISTQKRPLRYGRGDSFTFEMSGIITRGDI